MSFTLVAAIWTPLQGLLLTAEALCFFIAAMILLPHVHRASASTGFWGLSHKPEPSRAREPPEGDA
jgi:hypothetical protein